MAPPQSVSASLREHMYHLKLSTNDMKRERDYESEGNTCGGDAFLSRPSGLFTFLQSCRQAEREDGGRGDGCVWGVEGVGTQTACLTD